VSGGGGVAIKVDTVPEPRLPEGMVADGVKLVRVGAEAGVMRDQPLTLLVAADCEASPESGEWLDSVAYYTGNGTVQVAVRDKDWLEAGGIVSEHVAYERHGLCQTVTEAPSGTVLHVSVAWRALEGGLPSTDVSTWFAADLALPA
jgi:hypothetical protein